MPSAEAPLGPSSFSDYGNPEPEWLSIDWREHLRRVELPGAAVNYVEIGEGEPLVFVHGISSCWQAWLENLPHFGRGHRAIALDLPGFGKSPMPSWEIDIPAYGRLLHDFCEKLGVERSPMLVGNSLGGFVAAEAVTAAPGRFDRLVLASAAGIVNTWNPQERAVLISYAWRTFGPAFFSRREAIMRHPRLRQAVFGAFVRYPNGLRPELLWEQLAGGAESPGFSDALRAAIGHDIRERLPQLRTPTQIVWGFNDRVIPVQAALSYHRRIPGSKLEIFERTGHLPQLERPARFNALLDEFLSE
ncbi:MAG TPA: alpha/beta hydrolase [Solirubrobacterales bacterium]|nr:alpha/beta hydrolase [Solirubrobacterales bacterium]